MAATETFKTLYTKLNSEQKKAVDAIDGPVMVIAGPGTGKTQILSLRIANILLKTDTAPENILALTFTESGVFSMRKRLVDIIGSAAYKVPIYTFHGFCNDIIKNYPDEFPRIIGSNAITDIDQIKIIQEIITTTALTYLRPYGDPLYYVRPLLSMVKNLKREAISPEQFEKIVAEQEKDFKKIPDLVHEKGAHKGKMKGMYIDLEKKINKNKELAVVYERYETALQKKKFYDYEDMIVETIKAFEHAPDLLLRLQEMYHYILADEHQDTNSAQNKILELLSNFHDNPNLFIVGDEKQAIFRFQGASLDNFLYFKKIYPSALVISLENNYRSTQIILDAAHSLIAKNPIDDEKLRVRLLGASSHKEMQSHVLLSEMTRAEQEYAYIVADVKKKIAEGIDPNQIALIYRDNKDAFPLARELSHADVPYTIQSDHDVLSDNEIQKLVVLLRAVENIGDNELVSQCLYLDFLKLNSLDVYKAINYSYKNKRSLTDVLSSKHLLKEAAVEDIESFFGVYSTLSTFATVVKNTPLTEALEQIINESGYLAHVMNVPGSLETYARLEVFFNEAKKVATTTPRAKVSDFLAYLHVLEEYRILIKAPLLVRPNSVRLMTAHKSKGLEFEYVYIVGAYDTHWGNKKEFNYFHVPVKGLMSIGVDPMQDERRLFYVALTRAKKQVMVSYAKEGENGKSQLPCQFIEEINPELVERVDTSTFEKSLPAIGGSAFAVSKKRGIDIKEKDFLRELFLEQGLSITALNAYIRCPWDYFFNNLLRVPRAQKKHQMYGIAIHASLKVFFDKYKIEEDMSKASLLTFFESTLNTMALSPHEYDDSLEKGKRALGGYYDFCKNSWPRNLFTEFAVSGIPVHISLPEQGDTTLMLRGVLDKIEILQDNTVNVVDYKTGAPRSRNSIMGATKSSDGDYYRQLLFYKLLLDGYDKNRYNMTSGTIEFIEPDEKGHCKREHFPITEEDTKPLLETIQNVAGEIMSFSFWDSECGEKDCEYCRLRKMLK